MLIVCLTILLRSVCLPLNTASLCLLFCADDEREKSLKEPLERRIRELEATVALLSGENAALKSAKVSCDKDLSDVKSSLSQCEAAVSSLRLSVASLSSEKAEWQKEKTKLEDSLTSLRTANLELSVRAFSAERDKAIVEKDKAAVEVQLEKMTSEVSSWRQRLRLLAKSFERCVTFFDGKIGVPESFPSRCKDPVNGGVMFDCVMTEASREVVDRASAIAASLAAGDAFEDMFCVGHPLSFSEGHPRATERALEVMQYREECLRSLIARGGRTEEHRASASSEP